MQVLERIDWQARADAHAARVDAWTQPYLARRRTGEKHPVHDFLFTYYSQRPTALRRWHPGLDVVLLDAPEYADLKGYAGIDGRAEIDARAGIVRDEKRPPKGFSGASRHGLSVSGAYVAAQRPLAESIRRLLVATASRPATLGCFGLHEWAMVHREPETRHDWPLRLGGAGTDQVVESHRIGCSHFDAFRFFSDSARPLNTLQPGRDDRSGFEQPGCLHAGMDLYKHAFRLSPMVPSDLVADCFALAWEIRELDMRASPYDFSRLDYEPVRIETAEGKQAYAAAQRVFAERGAPLRQRLIEECDRVLGRVPPAT